MADCTMRQQPDRDKNRQTDRSFYSLPNCKCNNRKNESILSIYKTTEMPEVIAIILMNTELNIYIKEKSSRQTDRQTNRHRRELRSRYTTIDNRLDIAFFDSDSGNNVDLEISLTHPWSSDIFPSSAGVSGAAAERRAERKKEKYSKQQLPGVIIAINPTGNGAFWRLGDRWVETPVQIIKEVIRQSGTTECCRLYRLLIQTLFYSAPEV